MNFLRLIMIGLSVCMLFNACGENELKRRTVGYKGKAKSNPFLAAERFLAEQGQDASSEHGLGRLDYETGTLFLPPTSINTVGRAKRLMDWVSDGGHLVLMIEGGEMGGNDFSVTPGASFWSNDEISDGVAHICDALNVKYEKTDEVAVTGSSMDIDDWEAMAEKDRVLLNSETSEINLGNGKMAVHYWTGSAFKHKRQSIREYASKDSKGEDDEHHFLSVTHDMGRVSLLSDARPFRNRYLGYADHAKFLATLVDLSRPGKVIFSSGDGDGFFAMVWRHFKMAVLGLLAAVIFWLWRHLPRYGPEQDIADGSTREFSDQLRGIGRFLWHHKRDDTLLDALRSTVNRRLSLHPGISHEGIFAQLAETTALPVESVIEAMTREHITEPSVMVRVIKNLQEILKHIH